MNPNTSLINRTDTIDGPEKPTEYVLYKRRWYIVGMTFLLSLFQSIFWTSFAPVADDTQAFYQTSEFLVNLQYTFGYMIFLPTIPFLGYVLTSPESLRKLIIVSTICCVSGGALRCLSLFQPHTWWSITLLCCGQVINALAGPVVLGGPPKISSIWVSPHERTLSTAIIYSATNFGSAIIFAAGPHLLEAVGFKWYLIIQAIVGAVLLLPIFFYFPSEPPTPTCLTSSIKEAFSIKVYLQDIKLCLVNPSFMIVVFCGGLQSGLIGGWQGLLDSILGPQHFSEDYIGWLGCGSIFSVAFGTVICGVFADHLFYKKYKLSLILLSLVSTAYLAVFCLSFPSIFSSKPLLSSGPILIGCLVVLNGFLFGCTIPLAYELCVELAFPVNPGTSASVFSLWANGAGAIFLFSADAIPASWITSIVVFGMSLCTLLFIFVKEEYRRLDRDELNK